MRVLYFAKDAPTVNSGYGKCGREILTRLKNYHDVACFATVGNKASFLFEYQGIPIYPGTDDVMGQDLIERHLAHFKADLLITQMDIWPFSRLVDLAAQECFPWLAYVPIDFDPVPSEIVDKLRPAVFRVAMSKWGQKKMEEAGLQATTIHHGIDSKVYRLLDAPERLKCRVDLGFEKDCFLIGMVQANQLYRKAWVEQLQAVAEFAKDRPNVRLYIHSLGNLGSSYDLDSLVRALDLAPITRIADEYQFIIGYTEEQMAKIYNAFDVLLYATAGEGFGLPIIEAQACGTPVISTNATSMPELNLDGLNVQPIDWTYSPNPVFRKAIPSQFEIVQNLKCCYEGINQSSVSRADKAKRLWGWDTIIIPQWLKVIDQVQTLLSSKCYSIPAATWTEESKKIRLIA